MPRLLRKLIVPCTLVIISFHAIADKFSQEQQADIAIKQLYRTLHSKPQSNLPSRIDAISTTFLEKPYLKGALGEGAKSDYDNLPLYRIDAFDCETFVDTVLALTLADNLKNFKQYINKVRYKKGHVSFINRNHFTCLDWNQNNQQQGFIKDITSTIKDKKGRSVSKTAATLIDKPSFYRHLTPSIIRVQPLNTKDKDRRLIALKQQGKHLPRQLSRIPYIPLTALFDENGKANRELFNQIPDGSIIEIVRPNWDLHKQIGTHLNVSHLGFAIRHQDTLIFRAATSTNKKIVDCPLIDYLRETRKSPTIKGINIQIISK